MIIKVCGMRDGENIRQVTELGVDWIGMIFWEKSPRNVTMIPTHAGIIPDRAPQDHLQCTSVPSVNGDLKSPLKVGVFVDEMPQNIITRVFNYRLDLIQLHGHETPTMIRNLRSTLDPDIRPGIKIIKAINVASRDDVATYKTYEDCVDYFLFDTKVSAAGHASRRDGSTTATPGSTAHYGGSGIQFDWSVLDAYDGELPFLLSGGIGPDDAKRVSNYHHPKCIGIDLNSRFETEPGVKDVNKLKLFLEQL